MQEAEEDTRAESGAEAATEVDLVAGEAGDESFFFCR